MSSFDFVLLGHSWRDFGFEPEIYYDSSFYDAYS